MSEFFQEPGDKVRIPFPDGQWCEVKPELTQGDQDYIITQLASANGKPTGEVQNLGSIWLLERTILAWSFPLPVTRENISNLKQKYRGRILDTINRLNEEAREFSKNS